MSPSALFVHLWDYCKNSNGKWYWVYTKSDHTNFTSAISKISSYFIWNVKFFCPTFLIAVININHHERRTACLLLRATCSLPVHFMHRTTTQMFQTMTKQLTYAYFNNAPYIFYYFVLWPKNAQLFHKWSHLYMFRHNRVILREFVINILPSYISTSISNATVGNTIYN